MRSVTARKIFLFFIFWANNFTSHPTAYTHNRRHTFCLLSAGVRELQIANLFFFFFAPRDGHKLFSVGCDYWHMLLPVMWKRVLRVDKVFACGWGRWRRRRGVTLLFISTLTNLPFSFKFPLLGRLLVWPHRSP